MTTHLFPSGHEEGRHGGQEHDGTNEGGERRPGSEQKPLRRPPLLLPPDDNKDLPGTSQTVTSYL